MHAFLLAAVLVATKPVDVIDRWDGMIAEETAKTVVGPGDFVADANSFASFWKAWRPSEAVPSVDFASDLVLVGIVPGPNRVLLEPVVDDAGRVSFMVGGTKRGGPGFGYALVRIRRAGVMSVNDKPIAAAGEADGTNVKVIGVVRTGLVAVGGETTGMTITTDSGTYELDTHGDVDLARRLQQLDGKRAAAEGRLSIKIGVEVSQRRIIEVSRIASSEK